MTIRHQTRRIGIAASLALAAVAGTTALSGCTTGEATTKLAAEDSPLYKLLGSTMGAGDDDAQREQMRKVEAAIAQCMKDEGFEYTPTDSAAAQSGDADSTERETEKWVAEHGYGIVEDSIDSADSSTDPNEEYMASLSETEQAAYHDALSGRQLDEEPPSGKRDPETAGCAYNAYLEVQGVGSYWEDEKFTDLFESMSDLWTKLDDAPELKAANAKWADCMADAGHGGMKKQSDAVDAIQDKHQALVENEDGSLVAEPSKKELKALQDEEIEMALADFRCATKVGYTETQRKVQFALEDKFIQAHKAELDELIDTYGDKK